MPGGTSRSRPSSARARRRSARDSVSARITASAIGLIIPGLRPAATAPPAANRACAAARGGTFLATPPPEAHACPCALGRHARRCLPGPAHPRAALPRRDPGPRRDPRARAARHPVPAEPHGPGRSRRHRRLALPVVRSSRPLADEHQVGRTVFGYIALLYGSRILPNLERSGAEAREPHARGARRTSPTGLKAGENILLYPVGPAEAADARGRRQRQRHRDASSRRCPTSRIVLVRQNGLWGSSFSIGVNGRDARLRHGRRAGPQVPAAQRHLLHAAAPRHHRVRRARRLPAARARRAEINRYLEALLQRRRRAATRTCRTGSGSRAATASCPIRCTVRHEADASAVAPATRDLVLAHLAEVSGRTGCAR